MAKASALGAEKRRFESYRPDLRGDIVEKPKPPVRSGLDYEGSVLPDWMAWIIAVTIVGSVVGAALLMNPGFRALFE